MVINGKRAVLGHTDPVPMPQAVTSDFLTELPARSNGKRMRSPSGQALHHREFDAGSRRIEKASTASHREWVGTGHT
jgi:hypothetical protein